MDLPSSVFSIHFIKGKKQGPVVQCIVSLTKSLVEDLLSVLVLTKTVMAVFFAEKL